MFYLVVKAPFEHKGVAYARGARVIDQALVAELSQAQPHSVLKVSVPYAEQVAGQEAAKAAASE